MNRYPLWKYLLVLAVLGLGLLYTLPNFFGDTLAVQISTNRQSLAINSQTEARVSEALRMANIPDDGVESAFQRFANPNEGAFGD